MKVLIILSITLALALAAPSDTREARTLGGLGGFGSGLGGFGGGLGGGGLGGGLGGFGGSNAISHSNSVANAGLGGTAISSSNSVANAHNGLGLLGGFGKRNIDLSIFPISPGILTSIKTSQAVSDIINSKLNSIVRIP